MPGMNGIEAARRMVKANPRVKIVALSAHTDRRFMAEMLRAGAKGYLPKDDAFEELALAVHAVVKGQTYVSPGVAGDMVQDYLAQLPKHVPMPHENLSPREREVMLHLADGKSIKEIAFAMGISTKTVETFRRRLMAKLGAQSNTDVAKYAIRSGLTLLE
jgi:DNA-binding NarL/FixJ family response regulator